MNTPDVSPSQQICEVLNAEVPLERIAAVLSEGLAAMTRSRAGVLEPDWRTRMTSAQLALAYSVGKPIERQQIVVSNVSADPVADIEERLSRSPALRASLAATLAKIEQIKTIV